MLLWVGDSPVHVHNCDSLGLLSAFTMCHLTMMAVQLRMLCWSSSFSTAADGSWDPSKGLALTCPRVPAGENGPRRAMQLWRWLYFDDNWISTFEETISRQNGLSQSFCDKAKQLSSVDGGLLLEQVVAAKDGTRKLVFKLTEGGAAGKMFCRWPLLHGPATSRC